MKSDGVTPPKGAFVCGLHFKTEDFQESSRHLKSDAIPSENLWWKTPKRAPKKSQKLPRRVLFRETLPSSSSSTEVSPEIPAQETTVTTPAASNESVSADDPNTSPESPVVEIDDSSSKDHRLAFLEKKYEYLEKLLESLSKIFNKDQLEHLMAEKKRINWCDDTYKKAIHMHAILKKSGYEFLRDTMKFPLPGLTAIKKRLQVLDFRPGQFDDAFKLLKFKADRMEPGRTKHCAMVFDELSIEPQIEYDLTSKTIIGFCTLEPSEKQRKKKGSEEIPVGEFDFVANKAQVYMLAGIGGERWHQVLGYDLTTDSFDANAGKKRVETIVRKARSIDVLVKAAVADQGGCNRGV